MVTSGDVTFRSTTIYLFFFSFLSKYRGYTEFNKCRGNNFRQRIMRVLYIEVS